MNIVVFAIVLVWFQLGYGAPFAYDRAAYAAQKGDWMTSNALFNGLVTNYPDNPEIMYDSGVACYKQKQFEQAKVYFNNAINACNQRQNTLKEQAYFNVGNTNVQLGTLEDAVENYKKALEINPNDERAKHNLEIVLKMLQQKQQQQNQEKQKDNQSNKDKQKQSDQQQQNKQNAEKQEHGKSEQKDADKKQNKDKKQQEQGKQKPGNENKKDKERGKQDPQSKEVQQKTTKQNQEQSQREKNEQGQQVEQGNQAGKLNMYLAQILNEREKSDAHLNKQMIKSCVKNTMMGQQGENCW